MTQPSASLPRRLAALAASLTLFAACGGDDTPPVQPPATDALYAVAFSVSAPDGSSANYLQLRGSMPEGSVTADGALELAGSPWIVSAQGAVFVGSSETYSWTRYEVQEGKLVKGASLSFATEGMKLLYRAEIVSATQAFSWNAATFELVEWNPTTMTLTQRHDLTGLKRDDYGMEWRGTAAPLYRAQDGVLFYYVGYNNKRTAFLDRFFVVAFDTRTGAWQRLEDSRCGSSAGFGGWVDEAGDTYLFSDNFGALAELNAGVQRPACLLRVKAGERTIDPDYLVDLNALIGGKRAWGLYYAGNGRAYTSGLDMARKGEYSTAYNFLFANIHPFYALDVGAKTATEMTALAPAGIGWNPFRVEGQLFLPRTTATYTKVGTIETAESAVLKLDAGANTAAEVFRVPGTISLISRLK